LAQALEPVTACIRKLESEGLELLDGKSKQVIKVSGSLAMVKVDQVAVSTNCQSWCLKRV